MTATPAESPAAAHAVGGGGVRVSDMCGCAWWCVAGDVACDMYHKYDQDFRMMKAMGIKHYR